VSWGTLLQNLKKRRSPGGDPFHLGGVVTRPEEGKKSSQDTTSGPDSQQGQQKPLTKEITPWTTKARNKGFRVSKCYYERVGRNRGSDGVKEKHFLYGREKKKEQKTKENSRWPGYLGYWMLRNAVAGGSCYCSKQGEEEGRTGKKRTYSFAAAR